MRQQIRKNLTQYWRIGLEKGGFKSNFLHTFSSKFFIISLSFIFTPILSRLYSPEQYGTFSIFTSICTNFAILSSFSYNEAALIAKKDSDFHNLIVLSSLLLILTSSVFYLFLPEIISLINSSHVIQSNEVFYMIFFGAITYSLTAIFSKFNVHYNEFAFVSKTGAAIQLTSRLISVLATFSTKLLPFGLMIADTIGKLIFTLIHVKKYFKIISKEIKEINIQELLVTFKLFHRYPIYFLPSKYLTVLVNQTPIYVLSTLYTIENLGQYSIASSLVVLPVNLIGNSLISVYVQRVKNTNDKDISQLTYKLIITISILLAVPVLIIMFLSSIILPIALGGDWLLAGHIAQILSIIIIHEVIGTVLAGLFQIKSKEIELLFFQAFMFLSYILFVLFSYYQDISIINIIIGFSFLRLLQNMIKIHFLLHSISSKGKLLNFIIGLVLIVVFLLTWFVF